jgi:diamine N-acetyltransferase
MKVTIRRGDTQDFPAILSLIKEFSAFQKSADKVTITLEQMMEDENLFQCFVAEVNDVVVGFASFFFAYYSWTGKALYLDDLYVKQAFRKQNLGRGLLDSIIDFASTQNCKKVRWQVSKWNTNAIEFYKNRGASIDDVEINCDLLLS